LVRDSFCRPPAGTGLTARYESHRLEAVVCHLFVETSQIYLPERICISLEDRVGALRTSITGAFVHGVDSDAGADDAQRTKNEAFGAAIKAFDAEIPAAKKALKDEFRKMFGVETLPPAGTHAR
jgi:hypothetical protein